MEATGPVLERLLDPQSAKRFLSENLPLFRKQDGNRLVSVRLRDVRRRKWWQLQYHLEVEAYGADAPSRHILTCHYSDREDLSRISQRLRQIKLGDHQDRSVLEESWLDRSREGPLLVPFPLDRKLPHLSRALNPDEAKQKFQESGLMGGPGSRSAGTAEVVRYVPEGRCQIRYRFAHTQKSGMLLGKTFRDSRGKALSRVMNRVADLFQLSGNRELSAPRSPGYLNDWSMVVQEDLGGTTMHGLAQRGDLEEQHLTKAAQCLAVLHKSSLRLPDQHLVEQELELLRSAHEDLRQADLAPVSSHRLLEKLILSGQGLEISAVCPVHRDFHGKQVLIRGTRVWLIDLDTVTCGPPEIDLANFVAHLRLWSLQGFHLPSENGEESFIESYSRSAPGPAARPFRFFLATTFFRLGCRYAFRFHGRALAGQLLDLAGEALDSTHPTSPHRPLVRHP